MPLLTYNQESDGHPGPGIGRYFQYQCGVFIKKRVAACTLVGLVYT